MTKFNKEIATVCSISHAVLRNLAKKHKLSAGNIQMGRWTAFWPNNLINCEETKMMIMQTTVCPYQMIYNMAMDLGAQFNTGMYAHVVCSALEFGLSYKAIYLEIKKV